MNEWISRAAVRYAVSPSRQHIQRRISQSSHVSRHVYVVSRYTSYLPPKVSTVLYARQSDVSPELGEFYSLTPSSSIRFRLLIRWRIKFSAYTLYAVVFAAHVRMLIFLFPVREDAN